MTVYAVYIIVYYGYQYGEQTRWIDSMWPSDDMAERRKQEIILGMGVFGFGPQFAENKRAKVLINELPLSACEMSARDENGKFAKKGAIA